MPSIREESGRLRAGESSQREGHGSKARTIEGHVLEIADGSPCEIDIVQNQALLCPKLEGLDDPEGDCGRRK